MNIYARIFIKAYGNKSHFHLTYHCRRFAACEANWHRCLKKNNKESEQKFFKVYEYQQTLTKLENKNIIKLFEETW